MLNFLDEVVNHIIKIGKILGSRQVSTIYEKRNCCRHLQSLLPFALLSPTFISKYHCLHLSFFGEHNWEFNIKNKKWKREKREKK